MKIIWEEKDTASVKRLTIKIITWLAELSLMLLAGVSIAYFWGALEIRTSTTDRFLGFLLLYTYAKICRFWPKR